MRFRIIIQIEINLFSSFDSRYKGSVVAYKKSGDTLRVRVKFEKHSHDKFDKW